MTHAALGLRAHSGWAALVAVSGTRRSVEVIDRRRVELADPAVSGPKQPYHEAEGKEISKARDIVRRYTDDARHRALESFRAVVGQVRARGHEVVGCGLLLSSGRPLPALETILSSHALIHAADGELFRDALIDAAEHCGLPVTRVRERALWARGAEELRIPADELQRRINELGRSIGPPWRQDEKLSAMVGWVALVGSQR